ncbi:guanitoxin biosynthesis L-enduracididine beta-hydroxylase GntD [Nonomuraea guangzhouensis]|uniref:Guanitoxin biosynthesis L-enduracididine beta-hydroxylase GntD n=1 Tax=Nonomuraea guangzhouensis TaxID=1291555 RepID=A0ABW4FY25_9ACTN|nr:guanitoxin biosynthesis L-enduracididine beta-hydroxylase GntD [Nonomuraea guangzhouensis]
MDKLVMDATEKHSVTTLLDKFEAEFDTLDSDEALHRAAVLAHELPSRIRAAMDAFRLERASSVLCISGYEVDQERVGATPGHWRDNRHPSTHREDIMLVLLSSLIGDPFAWATQQDGRLIHDIIPIRGHEQEQLGSSSDALLTWHTEDAFHPLRGDYLSFACIRNPYAAATTVGYVDALTLPDGVKAVLFEERFGILPDESHLPKNNSQPSTDTFEGVAEMQHNPALVPVLFGDPDEPYIRADPYFMRVAEDDIEARNALDHLVKQMDENMFDLMLESGDFCFLDNFRVVHGRKPFKARHDGTDRWLRRINVTRDLRKSRAQRQSRQDRAIR